MVLMENSREFSGATSGVSIFLKTMRALVVFRV